MAGALRLRVMFAGSGTPREWYCPAMRTALLAILLVPWVLQAALTAPATPSPEGRPASGFALVEPPSLPLDGSIDPKRPGQDAETPAPQGDGTPDPLLAGSHPRLCPPGAVGSHVVPAAGPAGSAGHSTPGTPRAPPALSFL